MIKRKPWGSLLAFALSVAMGSRILAQGLYPMQEPPAAITLAPVAMVSASSPDIKLASFAISPTDLTTPTLVVMASPSVPLSTLLAAMAPVTPSANTQPLVAMHKAPQFIQTKLVEMKPPYAKPSVVLAALKPDIPVSAASLVAMRPSYPSSEGPLVALHKQPPSSPALVAMATPQTVNPLKLEAMLTQLNRNQRALIPMQGLSVQEAVYLTSALPQGSTRLTGPVPATEGVGGFGVGTLVAEGASTGVAGTLARALTLRGSDTPPGTGSEVWPYWPIIKSSRKTLWPTVPPKLARPLCPLKPFPRLWA
jgi:hypothetical protein